MRLVMVNADERLAQGKRHRLAGLETHHQRRRQSRPSRRRHGIELVGLNSGLAQRGVRHRNQILQMLTSGEFGDDAAVFAVDVELGADDAGEDGAAVFDDGGGGFVTRGFDA